MNAQQGYLGRKWGIAMLVFGIISLALALGMWIAGSPPLHPYQHEVRTAKAVALLLLACSFLVDTSKARAIFLVGFIALLFAAMGVEFLG